MVMFGLWGAGRLSFDQYQTGEACPILGNFIPACYIACFGYVLIAAGVVFSLLTLGSTANYLFWTGTAIAGGLAALATVLELIKGDICPVGPYGCLLYTSPSPRDATQSRMPSSA